MPALEDFVFIATDEALADLATVEQERKKVEEAVKETSKESKRSMREVVLIAQGTWDIATAIAEGAGISLSLVTKAVVQAAFNIAGTITQIATAESVTPFLQAQAVLSFIGAGLAIGAAIQAETSQGETEARIAQTLTTINRVNSYIGLWYDG